MRRTTPTPRRKNRRRRGSNRRRSGASRARRGTGGGRKPAGGGARGRWWRRVAAEPAAEPPRPREFPIRRTRGSNRRHPRARRPRPRPRPHPHLPRPRPRSDPGPRPHPRASPHVSRGGVYARVGGSSQTIGAFARVLSRRTRDRRRSSIESAIEVDPRENLRGRPSRSRTSVPVGTRGRVRVHESSASVRGVVRSARGCAEPSAGEAIPASAYPAADGADGNVFRGVTRERSVPFGARGRRGDGGGVGTGGDGSDEGRGGVCGGARVRAVSRER